MRLLACAPLLAFAGTTLFSQSARRGETAGSAQAWQAYAARAHATLTALHQTATSAPLPPPPEGVVDLRFHDFFGPIGDRGLDYSPTLRALDGRRVRLVGFMVRESEHAPGLLLLAGWPLTVQTKGSCTYDDAPPTAVHVLLPTATPRPVPYRPGRLILTGRVELGPRPEADGRISTIRLFLDESSAALFTPASATP